MNARPLLHPRRDAISVDLATTSRQALVVDLSRARLTDATGAAVLLHLVNECRAQRRPVRIVVAPGSITDRTLQRCGLGQMTDPRMTDQRSERLTGSGGRR